MLAKNFSKGGVHNPAITSQIVKTLYDRPSNDNHMLGLGFNDGKKIFTDSFLTGKKLSSSGEGIFTYDFTSAIEKVIRAITPNATPTWSLSESFPVNPVQTESIYVERINHLWGVTQDYSYGSLVPTVDKVGYETFRFTPPVRREMITVNEEELAFWRRLGTTNTRGAVERIVYQMELLMARLYNRFKLDTITTIYTGGLQYDGKLVSFGLNPDKRVAPLNGVWATATGPGGAYVINTNANPILDFYFWLGAGVQSFQKYLPLMKRIVMNPQTAQWFLANPNTRAFIQYAFANENFLNAQSSYNVQRVINFFIPGFNIPVVIEAAGYLTSATDEDSFVYFIPNGYIFFDIDVAQYGGPLGEYQITNAVQNGGWQNPQPGPWLQVEDNTVSGSKGGIGNPYINLISGFAGALNLYRATDILSAVVI